MLYEDGEWIEKSSYPTLFIATEQDLQEVQTMLLAFVANVNEEHILYGKYDYGEEDRVYKAAEIIKKSPLYIETIPDFKLLSILLISAIKPPLTVKADASPNLSPPCLILKP